jgi:hypothetical protein
MVIAIVVLGNAVELAGNIAAAVHVQRSAEAASAASALFAANSTQAVNESVYLLLIEFQIFQFISAVQSFCEVAVSLLRLLWREWCAPASAALGCLQWMPRLHLLQRAGS